MAFDHLIHIDRLSLQHWSIVGFKANFTIDSLVLNTRWRRRRRGRCRRKRNGWHCKCDDWKTGTNPCSLVFAIEHGCHHWIWIKQRKPKMTMFEWIYLHKKNTCVYCHFKCCSFVFICSRRQTHRCPGAHQILHFLIFTKNLGNCMYIYILKIFRIRR